ncbi:peptidyl-prolyl cis-trans isomerase [Colwellia psychrerythraea]|uniref:peptidylprolyl isomerase n=1 Tax=Colwellia psychrerythraea TaxID=28229 RepID=A0A099KF69_COLPS|nr:peptidylprolyl isomerase [Colwellia psychrerythraea]KGJ88602.1 PpiC-type peptidyl-prolyl cis-trans isomerase [Colwellia psychrerythraea]
MSYIKPTSFLREPFLHFIVLGIILFMAFNWLNPGSNNANKIEIKENKIKGLSLQFQAKWKRQPSTQELTGLIDNYITTEVYAKEAIALGLDQNDPLIKKRLRQKLEYMSENAMSLFKPNIDVLKQYFEQNKSAYTREPVYSFTQIYINPDKHKDNIAGHLLAVKKQLLQKLRVTPDASLLPQEFLQLSAYQIDRKLGTGFSEQLISLELGQWSEPVPSGVGMHFIRLTERTSEKVPEFDLVREEVLRDYSFQKRKTTLEQQKALLLSKYDVEIAPLKPEDAK